MQEAPIHCPADVDATEVEQAACEAPKEKKPGKPDDGVATPLSGGGGGSTPPTKPPVKD